MQLPFEPYENDAVEFGDQLQNTLMKLNENIHGYSVGITIYHEEMGTNHMFIKRLRDELAYQYQVTVSKINYSPEMHILSFHGWDSTSLQ